LEKVDRLARNYEDMVLPKQVDLEIHFAKGEPSTRKRQKPKFMQNIELATAVSYSDNLREEVIRGMRERAEQGSYPGHALNGYRNNRETRNIERHPEKSPIVKRAFELYASGAYNSGRQLRFELIRESNKTFSKHIVLDRKCLTMGSMTKLRRQQPSLWHPGLTEDIEDLSEP
jgi:DNA invertase Pin-like site-specific DNA recombinase